MCFFFCLFPYFSGPWADLHQTWWEGKGRPRILARGVHFLKGQGHISVSPRSLGQSSPNLEGRWRAALDIRWRAAPDISLRCSFFQRSWSSRSKVKFFFFFGGGVLFVPLLLPGPFADLHQTWWKG